MGELKNVEYAGGKNTISIVIEPNRTLLKTIEQMSKISGIGENSLREMVRRGEIEYASVGNKTLLLESSIIEWYERNKCPAIEHRSTVRKKIKLVPRRKIENGDSATTSQEQTEC